MLYVETKSGAAYEVDAETMHIRREGPVAETDADKPDGEWLPVTDFVGPLVGHSMVFMFPDGRVRTTTNVTKVVAK